MRILKISLLVMMMNLIVGCGTTKQDIDISKLKSTLESNKFTLYDIKNQIGYASEALYGSYADAKINFVKGVKKYDIQGVFLDECTNVYNKVGSDYKKQTDGGKNWTYLIVTTEEDYYFVGWVNDSYITIVAPISQEKKMNKLVKELGFK